MSPDINQHPRPAGAGPVKDPTTGEAAPAAVHRGQARMAYRLADRYRERLMHVRGLGWHAWDGRRWVEDEGEATRAVLETLRAALTDSLDQIDLRADLRADVRKCESHMGIKGVLDIAASLEAFATTVQALDADPYLLNCANGTLDLRTLGMRPHDPQDRITKVTGAAYDPTAPSAVWTGFLQRVLPDHEVRQFLQRYAGVALSGKVIEHVLAIFTGTGRNGKSVFVNALAEALGDYASTAEPDLFMHRENAHPTGEMDLLGVRWVAVSESDQGRKLAEATVKRLTGGDEIKARRMRQDFVAFTPSHTAVLVTNYLPKVSGDDPALWARLRVIPFDVVIPKAEQNPHLTEELAAEASAILSWAVAGWSDYKTRGLAEPAAVIAATGRYQAASDSIARFVTACCVTTPQAHASVADLWANWTVWSSDDGCEPISKKAFGECLDKKGFRVARGTGGQRRRLGIGLVDEREEPRPPDE